MDNDVECEKMSGFEEYLKGIGLRWNHSPRRIGRKTESLPALIKATNGELSEKGILAVITEEGDFRVDDLKRFVEHLKLEKDLSEILYLLQKENSKIIYIPFAKIFVFAITEEVEIDEELEEKLWIKTMEGYKIKKIFDPEVKFLNKNDLISRISHRIRIGSQVKMKELRTKIEKLITEEVFKNGWRNY